MDAFTENLLSRARERQKLLKNYGSESPQKATSSQPNLSTQPLPSSPSPKHSSEGNLQRVSSSTRISSSDFKNSKTLNIQKDSFNMEIKVSSVDNVRVEVQIDEEDAEQGGLRQDVKKRLDRLGKLYEGGEDADISSPIHRTEGKFVEEQASPKKGAITKRGLSKLADLAQTFNQFEDDLSHVRKEREEKRTTPRKSKKPPAPQPPVHHSPVKSDQQPNFKWDRKVLDSLECQGFTRTESSSRLIYNYDKKQKENKPESNVADKAALFETNPNRAAKDPALLSVSERKALFEKNAGTPLVPKAPFAMATPPVKEQKVPLVQKPATPTKPEPKSGGIANKVAALFEAKNTIAQEQIEKNVQEQRKKEMEMLLNRFHKAEETIPEENFDEDATEETAMLKEPTKIVASTSKEERRSGGNKRCSKADSPKVAAVLSEVKRIKVTPKKAGRLYPSLTDIESQTETENETRSPSPEDNQSSLENSIESADANTSFGRDILRVVCQKQNDSDLSDVLDDMDDYIDEALAYNEGPSPPKQGRKSPIESSNSFHYKSYTAELPTHVVDGDSVLPLQHTVSFYRKQQASTTPVRQVCRQPLVEEEEENKVEEELIAQRLKELRDEVAKQELIISQTSQALNLCHSTLEFIGSTEQVEAERVLLVATHRRQAAMHERQRLEVEKTLRPRLKNFEHLVPQKGTLTISKIVLPLKQQYVNALAAAGGKGHHVVCLVKYGAQVVPTQLVSTIASNRKNPDLELYIPGTVTLKDVYNDLTITFEVYCLQAQEEVLPHELKYHIKKSGTKLTPKKSKESRLLRPIVESPAGPQAVRSPTFALMGYVVVSVPITKKQWSLMNNPKMSPLEGTVSMAISCEMDVTVEHRGFLTMFEDVSGFGAWHRRWCSLKGHLLSYWKYPDDEKSSAPIGSIDLGESITRQVAPVSREMCARLHTFLLEVERDALPHDKDSLVTVRRGPKTVIRHLLSADTKEERVEWCTKFNTALAALSISRA